MGVWSRGMIFPSHGKGQGFNSPHVQLELFFGRLLFFCLLIFKSLLAYLFIRTQVGKQTYSRFVKSHKNAEENSFFDTEFEKYPLR